MKTYKQFLKEVAAETQHDCIVLSFGRMQPPTTGHAKLAEAVKKTAATNHCSYEIWLSPTNDSKKNPLQHDRKVFWAKKILKEQHIYTDKEYINTPIRLLKTKNNKYKNVIFVAGSDRVKEYEEMFASTNGKSFNFDSIKVVSAGERDPDADDSSGMSATKLRQAAINNDADSFKAGVKNLTDFEVNELIKELRAGLKIKDLKESIPGVSSLRNRFYLNEIFRVGDWCSDAAGEYEILDRGTNYVTVVNEHGELHKKFIENLQLLEKTFEEENVDFNGTFKGYSVSSEFFESESIAEFSKSIVENYNNGKTQDGVAVLKTIKSLDEIVQRKNILENVEKLKQCLSRIGEVTNMKFEKLLIDLTEQIAESDDRIKNTDKLKVAIIISDTLGGDSSSSSSPEALVNLAIKSAMRNPQMTRGASFEIINRMLDLARQVGIKFDEKLLGSQSTLKERHEFHADSLPKALIARRDGSGHHRVHVNSILPNGELEVTHASNGKQRTVKGNDVIPVSGFEKSPDEEKQQDYTPSAHPLPYTSKASAAMQRFKHHTGV
jgi:hypothetical protein